MRVVGNPRLFAAMGLMLLLSCTAHQSTPPACPVTPSLDVHGIPKDVCPPHDMRAFGYMAWQTFKTLVWPASSRGVADTSRKITEIDRALVFETYKADWETFQRDKKRPLAWHRYPTSASVCANASSMPPLDKNALVLAALHKFHNLDQLDRDPDGKYADNGSEARRRSTRLRSGERLGFVLRSCSITE